jgi:hypothetical protein
MSSDSDPALRGLFAVAENYPELKANENFLRLQVRQMFKVSEADREAVAVNLQ